MAVDLEKTDESVRELSIGDGFAVDILTTFVGFFSTVLAIIISILNLLMEPSLSVNTEPGAPVYGQTLFHEQPYEYLVFFGTLVLFLLLCAFLNNALITTVGKKAMMFASLTFGLLGSLLFFMGISSYVYLAILAIALCLFLLLWGSVLATLRSNVLIFILVMTSLLTGLIVLLDTKMSTGETSILLVTLFVITWISLYRVSKVLTADVIYPNIRQSIERRVKGRGNNFTLVLVGAMFGIIAVLVWIMGLSIQTMTLTLGLCLLLSSLIVTLFRRNLHTSLGDIVRRLLALTMIVGLVPFPFVGRLGQLICICFLFIVSTINLILVIDAILETSRFNQISPFWIISLEGGLLFVGVSFVIACSTILLRLTDTGLMIMIFSLAGASSIMQIYINNQVYPIFIPPVLGRQTPGEQSLLEQDSIPARNAKPLPGSALWRNRINQISAESRLSLRQKEIMEMLIKGRDLNYIIAHLEISRSTAKTHISNLYRKMNVHSKQDLIDLMELFDESNEQVSEEP